MKKLAAKPKHAARAGLKPGPTRAATPMPLPRERQGAVKSSLEYALLGLVSESAGVSGYDIVKIFDLSMRHFWHAHQGQIYPTLERMEAAGWIKSRQVIQQGRPNKREFSITPAGERALTRWLHSPFEKMKLKYPPLLRTRFLGHLGAEAARAQLEEHKREAQTYLDELRAIERGFLAQTRLYPNENAMFSFFTLKYGIGWMEETLRWCDWAIAEVERNLSLFRPRQKAY
ncbi:MAG: PadR family transcriptional regulator [Candidatus Binataceae bacterium]